MLLLLSGSGNARPAFAGPLREITAEERDTLWYAEDILLRDCMVGRGFTYVANRPDPELRRWDFPYLIDDVSWARAHGFGRQIEEKAGAARARNPNQLYLEALSEDRQRAFSAALYGPAPVGISVVTPTGTEKTRSSVGCQAQAQRHLYGDLKRWFRSQSIVESLGGLYLDKVTDDPRYRAASIAWSACLRAESGVVVATPAQLRGRLPELTAGRSATGVVDREVELAVAEATCAQRSGLGPTARALRDHYRQQVLDHYKYDVDEYLRLQLAALPLAELMTRRPSQD